MKPELGKLVANKGSPRVVEANEDAGEYAAAVASIKNNILLSRVTVVKPEVDLLQNATTHIMCGRRSGLIGWNRYGKSTLVQQKIDGSDESAVQILMQAGTERIMLNE
jgi:ABC-type transport system involved in cytochrome bd biosynthesis fused ATPase/permease subunit